MTPDYLVKPYTDILSMLINACLLGIGIEQQVVALVSNLA